MAAFPAPHDLLARLRDYRSFDEERQSEIDFLAQTCLKLQSEQLELRSDLDDERNTRRAWKKRAEDAEAATARKFAVVLVDGDGYVFRKAFFEALSTSGGSRAANELYLQVINDLKAHEASQTLSTRESSAAISADCDVLVNVYANRVGLAKTLAAAGLLQQPAHIDLFFSSFNQSRSLFQFIDCGPGKERVDAKLRDTFRFYAHNAQCQQIYLACTHDNGYIAELDKYRHDSAMEKIVLVHAAQTPSASRAYSGLPFKSVRFGSVFESSPLNTSLKEDPSPPGLDRLSLTSSATDLGSHDFTPAGSGSSNSSTSAPPGFPPLLPVTNNPIIPTQAPPAEVALPPVRSSTQTGTVTAQCDTKSGIPVNRFGQRVDRRLRMPTNTEMEAFENRIYYRKLCNEHHLRDNCETYNCRYDHEKIDATMKNTLRYKARSIACAQGSKCRRLDCFYGHQCPWGNDSCGNPKCSFIKAGLHDIKDLEVVKLVPAQPV